MWTLCGGRGVTVVYKSQVEPPHVLNHAPVLPDGELNTQPPIRESRRWSLSQRAARLLPQAAKLKGFHHRRYDDEGCFATRGWPRGDATFPAPILGGSRPQSTHILRGCNKEPPPVTSQLLKVPEQEQVNAPKGIRGARLGPPCLVNGRQDILAKESARHAAGGAEATEMGRNAVGGKTIPSISRLGCLRSIFGPACCTRQAEAPGTDQKRSRPRRPLLSEQSARARHSIMTDETSRASNSATFGMVNLAKSNFDSPHFFEKEAL